MKYAITTDETIDYTSWILYMPQIYQNISSGKIESNLLKIDILLSLNFKILYILWNCVEKQVQDKNTETLKKRIDRTVAKLKKSQESYGSWDVVTDKFIKDYSNNMVVFARFAVIGW